MNILWKRKIQNVRNCEYYKILIHYYYSIPIPSIPLLQYLHKCLSHYWLIVLHQKSGNNKNHKGNIFCAKNDNT